MNEYIPYEIAQLLKEKGFNEPCYNCYLDGEILHYDYCSVNSELVEGFISAPTYQSVFAWFRTYYIYAWIEPYSMDIDGEALDFKYCMFVGDNYEESNIAYSTFEEASDECINYICEHYI